MRVYLDNCCFNRPFDDQGQIRIRLETEAKLDVQARIARDELELSWSYVLDYENAANPFEERKRFAQNWHEHAVADTEETGWIAGKATALRRRGLRSKDALHIACAIATQCDYFLTTDDVILKRAQGLQEIRVLDPLTFVREVLQ